MINVEREKSFPKLVILVPKNINPIVEPTPKS
jgi:hypothetical protein